MQTISNSSFRNSTYTCFILLAVLLTWTSAVPAQNVANPNAADGPLAFDFAIPPADAGDRRSEGTFTFHMGIARTSPDLDDLRARAAKMERESIALATSDSKDKEKKLKELVANSFQARQQVHLAELAAIREQMQQVEKLIEQRERHSETIIDRRVEELLNPELVWNARASQRPGSEGADSGSGPDLAKKEREARAQSYAILDKIRLNSGTEVDAPDAEVSASKPEQAELEDLHSFNQARLKLELQTKPVDAISSESNWKDTLRLHLHTELLLAQMREQKLVDSVGEGHPSVHEIRRTIEILEKQIRKLGNQ